MTTRGVMRVLSGRLGRRTPAREESAVGDARKPTGMPPVRWTFLVCLAVTFANFAVWSWATPLFASPDEPTQVARAAAVVRGQLVGKTVGTDRNAMTTVRIPFVLASGEPMATCFQFRPTVPASCQPAMPTSTKVAAIHTYVGRYPPLYYLIVGLPSRLAVSARGVYLMRLASALLDAIFVSLALFAVVRWSRNRLLLLAVMAGATPTVWFLGGVVNPSGLEICAAICLWTSGTVLLFEHADAPPPGLVALVAGAFAAFVLTRPLSPLWCAIAVVMLALAGGLRRLAALFSSRSVQLAIAPLAACTAFAVWWIVDIHSLDLEPSTAPVPHPETFGHVVPAILDHFGSWSQEMVGIFGWVDTPSPVLTYVVWAVVVGGLVLLAWARAAKGVEAAREALAVALVVLAVFVVPTAIVYREVHRIGIVWQGRDILPVAVGIPVVAAAALGAHRLHPRGRRLLVGGCIAACVLLAVADYAAFFEALRRYAVGVDGPINFLGGPWHPPLGNTAVVAAALVSVVLWVLMVSWAIARLPSPTSATPTDSLMSGSLSSEQRVGLDTERRPGS